MYTVIQCTLEIILSMNTINVYYIVEILYSSVYISAHMCYNLYKSCEIRIFIPEDKYIIKSTIWLFKTLLK